MKMFWGPVSPVLASILSVAVTSVFFCIGEILLLVNILRVFLVIKVGLHGKFIACVNAHSCVYLSEKVTFDLLSFLPAGHLQQLESLGVLESHDLHCLVLQHCFPRDQRWYS